MNWKILLCVFATLFVAACGGRSESITEVMADAADLPCIPGAQVACACLEGAKGYQICKASGHEFYPCECPGVTEDAGQDAKVDSQADDADAATPDAEIDSDAQAEADAQADADAGNDADADALAVETGVDAGADADAAEAEASTKVILTISGVPGAPTEFIAGAMGAKPHRLQFCTTKKIELTTQQLYIQTVSAGAKTQGSIGTRYFQNIRLVDGTTTAMGPTELKTANNETMPQRAEFSGDTIAMDANTCKIIGVMMDIWNVEDAPGELYNQVYQIQDIGAGAIVKADGDEPVDRPMNSDEFLWTPDSTSANFKILPLQPVLEVKTSSDTPASDIVVAGKDVLYPFSKQDICNLTDNPVTFGVSYIQQACDGAGGDFYLVNAHFGGGTYDVHSSSAFDMFQVAFAIGSYVDVTVPAKSCIKATLSGRTQPVMPSSSLPGDNTVARSGHAPCLRLVKFADSNGVQIPTKYTASDKPNPMVLRKAKPYFTKHNLVNYVLMPGVEQEHYKWQIGADGAIAWKQIMFRVEASNLMSFSNYRLYKNSTQMPMAEYSIMDAASGQDLRTTSWSPTYNTLVISFKQEQTETQSGDVYTLLATGSGPGAGQSVMVRPTGGPSNELITGEVKDNTWAGFNALQDLFVVKASYTAIGYFIWSDLSEVPHIAQPLPSSKDWTTAWLVDDLSQATTLTN